MATITTKTVALRNAIRAAFEAGVTLSQRIEQVKALIKPHLTRSDRANQEFILTEVAAPLAALYSQKTGEELKAYITNRGTVAIKSAEAGNRTNNAAAANMMLRKFVVQESRVEREEKSAGEKLYAQFLKLDAAEQRRFRKLLAAGQ